MSLEKYCSAVHEAAHLVAMQAAGVDGSARIWRDHSGWRGEATSPESAHPVSLAVIAFAGPAAERQAGARAQFAESDRRYLADLQLGEKQLQSARELAEEIVAGHWNDVEQLATELMMQTKALTTDAGREDDSTFGEAVAAIDRSGLFDHPLEDEDGERLHEEHGVPEPGCVHCALEAGARESRIVLAEESGRGVTDAIYLLEEQIHRSRIEGSPPDP